MTQLLVSVRSATEAIAAVEGGADIVDVKEPHHGSLGCASVKVISEIAHALKSDSDAQTPLSLALGELLEWQSNPRQQLRSIIQSTSPHFLKLGLAGTWSSHDEPISHSDQSWFDEWRNIRAEIPGQPVWVAVAYADVRQAASPRVDDVLSAAISTGCGILLIDTYVKDGTSLADHLSLAELKAVRARTTRHGLKLALAGRISLDNLSPALSIHPDIIAVRGAVCECGDRTATVSRTLVQQFREAMGLEKVCRR